MTGCTGDASCSGGRHRIWPWLAAGALFGAALALVPFLVPVPRPKGLVDAEDLADPDSRFVLLNGLKFHYKEYGDPSAACTVVCLHGFASSVYSWRHLGPALAGRARVIAFDRLGFGLSARPLAGDWEGANPYSMDSSADQTIALMDALGVERAVLIGHSQGASIAVLAVDRFPDRVSALVLVNSPTGSPRFRERPYLDWMRTLPQAKRLGPLVPRPFFGKYARWFMSRAYADPTRLADETVELETKAARVKDWDLAYVELTGAQTGFQHPEAMGRIAVPTLLVAGRNDQTVPWKDQVKAAQAIPGSRIITFNDTGHVVPEERPGALAEVVNDFLDEIGC